MNDKLTIILFPMSNIPEGGNNFQQILSQNRYGIRSLQANYLKNQYDRMQQAKNAEKMVQRSNKECQLMMLNKLNDNYLNEITQNRRRKMRDMKALSMEYEDFIKYRQDKGRYDKYAEKHLEKSTLEAPTWIRDVFTERETYKKNMDNYNKALGDHVKMRELRKDAEKEEEMLRKRKINEEADSILKKEMEELEARHRQKSMFEKRQNQLLGVKSQYPQDIGMSGFIPQETVHRRREQDLYSQGLEVQLRKEQEKRYTSQEKMSTVNTNVYNPITNPMPFVYKNPNVLRMMANN